MTLVINLEPRKEEELRQRAARRGRDTNGYAVELLDRLLDEPEQPEIVATVASTQTLAELFAGRTGKIDSGGRFNYSRDTGKAYAESLLNQKDQRHLPEETP